MKKELEEKLFQKYPKIFKQKDLPISKTAMCWDIDTGDGWYMLIDELCNSLQFDIDNNNREWVKKPKWLFNTLNYLNQKVGINIGSSFKKYLDTDKKDVYYRFNSISSKIFVWLIDKLTTSKLVEGQRYPQLEAVQVKEKFGGLRFYVINANEEQQSVINFAESLSYSICETCGSTHNVTQTEGWVYTRCEKCMNELKKATAGSKEKEDSL